MSASKRYLIGVYDDDELLLQAVNTLRAQGFKIIEAFTPFTIH